MRRKKESAKDTNKKTNESNQKKQRKKIDFSKFIPLNEYVDEFTYNDEKVCIEKNSGFESIYPNTQFYNELPLVDFFDFPEKMFNDIGSLYKRKMISNIIFSLLNNDNKF